MYEYTYTEFPSLRQVIGVIVWQIIIILVENFTAPDFSSGATHTCVPIMGIPLCI